MKYRDYKVVVTLFDGSRHTSVVSAKSLDAFVAKHFNFRGVKSVVVYSPVYDKFINKLEKSEDLNPLNKVTCNYCSKELQSNEVVVSEIWENYSRKNMKFCSKEHASFYQMGAEG
jgi:hypothetical protein